jgi:hypothetical protein
MPPNRAAAAGQANWEPRIRAAVALLSSVATLMYAIRSKHATLSERDYTLLMVLKQEGPTRAEELLNALNQIRAQTGFTWESNGLLNDLSRLGKIALFDGTVDALVAQASDGRWSVTGL